MRDEQPPEWLDFAAIKQQADPVQVLDALGLYDGLIEQDDELIGWCPMGTRKHGKRDSFHVYLNKKTFKCFACKQRGSLLDLVARVREVPLREAAEHLLAINNGTVLSPEPADRMEQLADDLSLQQQERIAASVVGDLLSDELRVTLSLFEAVQMVKAKERHPKRLVVIDLDALAALQELAHSDGEL